jgi:hypothetical protein
MASSCVDAEVRGADSSENTGAGATGSTVGAGARIGDGAATGAGILKVAGTMVVGSVRIEDGAAVEVGAVRRVSMSLVPFRARTMPAVDVADGRTLVITMSDSVALPTARAVGG